MKAAGETEHERPVILVLCPDNGSRPTGLSELDDRAEVRYTDAAGLPRTLPGADVLFVWDFFSGAVEACWPYAERLQWVHTASAGVDTLMFDDLTHSAVSLTNAKGVFDQPIAEYTLAAVLAHAKQLHHSRDLQRRHRWEHRETAGIADQLALVVGTGGIGRATARLLAAAGMQVRGAGRVAKPRDPDFGDVIPSSGLAAQVSDVDHLVVAAPLTAATTGLINEQVLSAMKSTAHLINVGRGASVDESALIDALHAGRPAAATLDVFADEPLPAQHPFWDMHNVMISPHLSGDTVGWQDRLAGQFVANANRWLAGQELINQVDKMAGYAHG